MTDKVPFFNLKDGNTIPAIGIGTNRLTQPQKTVEIAIDIGYRLIDGAFLYKNEVEVGAGIRNKIKDGIVERKDMFIISKLWRTMHNPEDVRPAIESTLKNLGLKYVDVYLMHMPLAAKKAKNEYEEINLEEADIPIEDTWKAMGNLVKLGYTKSIGVSNFNSKQLARIINKENYFPVINEVEVNPYFSQKLLLEYCKSTGIQVIAYAPFYSPENPLADIDVPLLVTRPTITKLAEKHKKTPGQIILRYLYQIDCVPIPKSNSIQHLKDNIDIFGSWNGLDSNDMHEINKLNSGKRSFRFDASRHYKEYPFDEKF